MNTALCAHCGDELEGDERGLCRECANQAAGKCRWCSRRPPTADSDLCAVCEAAGTAAATAGTF